MNKYPFVSVWRSALLFIAHGIFLSVCVCVCSPFLFVFPFCSQLLEQVLTNKSDSMNRIVHHIAYIGNINEDRCHCDVTAWCCCFIQLTLSFCVFLWNSVVPLFFMFPFCCFVVVVFCYRSVFFVCVS